MHDVILADVVKNMSYNPHKVQLASETKTTYTPPVNKYSYFTMRQVCVCLCL